MRARRTRQAARRRRRETAYGLWSSSLLPGWKEIVNLPHGLRGWISLPLPELAPGAALRQHGHRGAGLAFDLQGRDARAGGEADLRHGLGDPALVSAVLGPAQLRHHRH